MWKTYGGRKQQQLSFKSLSSTCQKLKKKKKVACDWKYILTKTKFSGLQRMFSFGRTDEPCHRGFCYLISK